MQEALGQGGGDNLKEQIGQTKSLPRPAVSALTDKACPLKNLAETSQVLHSCGRPSLMLLSQRAQCPMTYLDRTSMQYCTSVREASTIISITGCIWQGQESRALPCRISLHWVLVPVAQYVMASWGWHHAHVLAARSRTLQRDLRAAMLLLLKKGAISPKLGQVSKHRGYHPWTDAESNGGKQGTLSSMLSPPSMNIPVTPHYRLHFHFPRRAYLDRCSQASRIPAA